MNCFKIGGRPHTPFIDNEWFVSKYIIIDKHIVFRTSDNTKYWLALQYVNFKRLHFNFSSGAWHWKRVEWTGDLVNRLPQSKGNASVQSNSASNFCGRRPHTHYHSTQSAGE